jgi:DtxR family Mn-dependent transcriptional regulator
MIENYIKMIYIIAQDNYLKEEELIEILKENENNSELSSMLDLLRKKGLVHVDVNGIILSGKGLDLAKKIYQKHELFEFFLEKFLDYDEEKAHEESEKLEHYISDELITKLRDFMAKKVKLPEKTIVPLTWLQEGEKGEVKRINGGWRVTQRLSHLGLTKDTPVRVVRTSPFGGPLEISVRDSHYVLGHGVAAKIMVTVKENGA